MVYVMAIDYCLDKRIRLSLAERGQSVLKIGFENQIRFICRVNKAKVHLYKVHSGFSIQSRVFLYLNLKVKIMEWMKKKFNFITYDYEQN